MLYEVITVDLPRGTQSGLIEAQRILKDTNGIAIIHLHRGDVVRHPLVQGIIDAYEAAAEDDRSSEKGMRREKAPEQERGYGFQAEQGYSGCVSQSEGKQEA